MSIYFVNLRNYLYILCKCNIILLTGDFMDKFKLDDGTICKLIYVYKNYILYSKKDDENIYASKYEIIDKKIVLNEVSDDEINLLLNKYKELGGVANE